MSSVFVNAQDTLIFRNGKCLITETVIGLYLKITLESYLWRAVGGGFFPEAHINAKVSFVNFGLYYAFGKVRNDIFQKD